MTRQELGVFEDDHRSRMHAEKTLKKEVSWASSEQMDDIDDDPKAVSARAASAYRHSDMGRTEAMSNPTRLNVMQNGKEYSLSEHQTEKNLSKGGDFMSYETDFPKPVRQMLERGSLALTELEEGSSGTFELEQGKEINVVAGKHTSSKTFGMDLEHGVTPLRPLTREHLDIDGY